MRHLDTQLSLYRQAEIGFALSRAIESTRELLIILNEHWQDNPTRAVGAQVDCVSDALHLLKQARP